MSPASVGYAALGIALLGGAAGLWARERVRTRLSRRLRAQDDAREARGDATPAASLVALDAWLDRAGVRSPGRSERFVAAAILAVLSGVTFALLLGWTGALARPAAVVVGIPVIGTALAHVLLIAPWLLALGVALAPALWVRAKRRVRVAAIERDLPLVLELLAVLAQAGLGFDAALSRVLHSEPARPLGEELRRYQTELLSGIGRVQCLRRMAARVAIPTLSSVVAALVQAEEVGSGLAEVLRPLADDLRARRRERALARAEALPERLVFPLMVGFLPGLMVWTLGPAIHQLAEVIGGILASR